MEGSERRSHLRLPKGARVTCQQVTYPLGRSPETTVQMLDVSEGGVKLESPEAMEAGTLVQLALSIEGWQRHTASFLKHSEEALSKPLTALGRVVRCVPAEGGSHELGVQFVDIWDDHWRAMRVFLEREAKGESAGEG